MKITRKEKELICRHWSEYKLRFLSDGTVMAKKGETYGVLYSPKELAAHLSAIRL